MPSVEEGLGTSALDAMARARGAWVRLHYVYPYPHVDEVLPLMASGRVLPYLDVPFQHAHPDVLRRMKRPASGEKNLERLRRWREICPQIVVRSTFTRAPPKPSSRSRGIFTSTVGVDSEHARPSGASSASMAREISAALADPAALGRLRELARARLHAADPRLRRRLPRSARGCDRHCASFQTR